MANQYPSWPFSVVGGHSQPGVTTVTLNPLSALATAAMSVSPIGQPKFPSIGLENVPSMTTKTPTPTRPINQSPPRSIQHLRFVLRRPPTSSAWGLTISMLDKQYLILGYVDKCLISQYTVFAGHAIPFFQQVHPIQLLRPGDVICSINERQISSFPSFAALACFLKQNLYLSIVVIRSLNLPRSIINSSRPDHSYWAAERTHCLLRRELQEILKPTAQTRVVSAEPDAFRINKVSVKQEFEQVEAAKPKPKILPFRFTNPLFRDNSGEAIRYDDDFEFDPDEGTRASQFLVPVEIFGSWLLSRKKLWQMHWNVYQIHDTIEDIEDDSGSDILHDFWEPQGFTSFTSWLSNRTAEWKRGYSWNLRKRKRIAETADRVVHFPSLSDGQSAFDDWLRVRKDQWRILRRKRQRMLEKQPQVNSGIAMSQAEECETKWSTVAKLSTYLPTTGEMLVIDSMLEEQERKKQEQQKTFDLSFVFDAKLGAPDDVIASCMRYLHPSEHGKLLCISSKTSETMKQRDEMWRQLCPTHWTLPRRPRKKWHDLYITKMRQEERASRKQSDDLLSRIASVLLKGDHLQKIEKLVVEGERKFSFDVDYVSGVVCERNSMLNLAVIFGRYKVARWLVDTKGADIESHDRGGFTPLLNAAWDGNMKIVRFLMSKGCDRTKVGTNHYSKPMASSTFKGYTAEGWARERDNPEVADLIKQGL